MPAAAPQRRPLDLAALEQYARAMKLGRSFDLPESRRKAVSVSRDLFVPTIQAEIGGPVPVGVYRYRVLLPIAQLIRESSTSIRRVLVARETDIESLQEAFIRHFGGVTVHHQVPSPVRGVGARDPSDVAGTLEQNEHAALEVYAAPIQAADDYFRTLRRLLEETLQEGVILIERQHVTLM